jgi:hypothetical protein
MAKTYQEELTEAVAVVGRLLEKSPEGTVDLFTLQVLPSGEYPFKVHVRDVTWPVPGLARRK